MGRERCIVGGCYIPHGFIAQLKAQTAIEQSARKAAQTSSGASSAGEDMEKELLSRKRHRRADRHKARGKFTWR
jgi:hypothetical protein